MFKIVKFYSLPILLANSFIPSNSMLLSLINCKFNFNYKNYLKISLLIYYRLIIKEVSFYNLHKFSANSF